MMSADVSHFSILPNTATTVVVPVNQEPIGSGIRLPVERITCDELERRRRADAASATPASAATPTLPSNVAVLQGMIVELRDALAGQKQRVAELEQDMNALLQRLLRKPRDVWPADQPSLFPEMQSPELAPEPPPTAAAPPEPDKATEARDPSKAKKKGHGRRSLEELLKSLPLQKREHTLTEAERLCPCCGRPRRQIGEQTSQQLEYIPAKLVCVQHVQFTYSCPHCPEHIVTTPKPPQPIDRGLAGPGLLALVTASKFDDYGAQGEAVNEMGAGLPWPGCRTRQQTAGMLLWSRAMVVSEAGKGATRSRQVRVGKTNASEPLMKCRNRRAMSKPGSDSCSGISAGETCLLPARHPALRRRESDTGSFTEPWNLSSGC